MAEREIETMRIEMDKNRKSFKSSKFLLCVEEENIKGDLEMLKGANDNFSKLLKENTDKKTGRVIVDKFTRAVEADILTQERLLRKLRLKTNALEMELKRIKQQNKLKLELSDSLNVIDMDKLQIENQQKCFILNNKNNHLMGLKKCFGTKCQNIVSLKHLTDDSNNCMKTMDQQFKKNEVKLSFTADRERENLNKIMFSELTGEILNEILRKFKKPDISPYIMMDTELDKRRKEKFLWERRLCNSKQTQSALDHQLKQLTTPVSSRDFRSTKSSPSKSSLSHKSSGGIIRKKTPYPHCTPASRMWQNKYPTRTNNMTPIDNKQN